MNVLLIFLLILPSIFSIVIKNTMVAKIVVRGAISTRSAFIQVQEFIKNPNNRRPILEKNYASGKIDKFINYEDVWSVSQLNQHIINYIFHLYNITPTMFRAYHLLCVTMSLYIVPIIYYYNIEKLNSIYYNILLVSTILCVLCSNLFWANPIKNNFYHKIDSIIAKCTYCYLVAYTIFINLPKKNNSFTYEYLFINFIIFTKRATFKKKMV